MDFKTSTFMYLLGGAVVVFVLAQSLFFLIRAWRQGKKIGLAESVMKKTVASSALFSIAPSIAILATVLTLSGALGIVLPWIRLSVIGNITYEVPAAQSALDALGLTGGLSREVTDKTAFSAAAWVMTLGSVMPLVILPFAVKFIQKKIGSAVHKNGAWANAMSTAAFTGLISAFIGRAILGTGDPNVIGDGAGVLSVAALVTSMFFMWVFMQINKKKQLAWIDTFAMPISLFIALGVVMLLNQVLPPEIAVLEWRG